MKEKFTPAPWRFNAHDGSITDCTKAENEIATAQLDDWHILGRGYANAHLIAAAPEMYAALESILMEWNLEPSDMDWIEKLLAEARGEL